MSWQCFWCGTRSDVGALDPSLDPSLDPPVNPPIAPVQPPNCLRCAAAAFGDTRESAAIPMQAAAALSAVSAMTLRGEGSTAAAPAENGVPHAGASPPRRHRQLPRPRRG